jgi:putative PIN family toxin of toxin-antitoxin system
VRVVLDTNIYISALVHPEGGNAALLDLWGRGRFTLLTSEYQLSEIRGVTRRAHLRNSIAPHQAGALVNQLRATAIIIEPRQIPNASPDPDDNRILAIAQMGEADYLASLDMRHVVKLEKLGKTKIVHARELLKKLS